MEIWCKNKCEICKHNLFLLCAHCKCTYTSSKLALARSMRIMQSNTKFAFSQSNPLSDHFNDNQWSLYWKEHMIDEYSSWIGVYTTTQSSTPSNIATLINSAPLGTRTGFLFNIASPISYYGVETYWTQIMDIFRAGRRKSFFLLCNNIICDNLLHLRNALEV